MDRKTQRATHENELSRWIVSWYDQHGTLIRHIRSYNKKAKPFKWT